MPAMRVFLMSVLVAACAAHAGAGKGFPATIDLADPVVDGTLLVGAAAGDITGFSLVSLPDADADGIDDFAIAARWSDTTGGPDAGRIYRVPGGVWLRAAGSVGLLDTPGILVLEGVHALDSAGARIGSGGDFDGDGLAELAIGATHADPAGQNSGQAYVVFGAAGDAGTIPLGELDGSNGLSLDGIDPDDRLGFAAATAGDVNGDGFDDLLVSAYHGDPGGQANAGEVYLLFGRDTYGAPAGPPGIDIAALDGRDGLLVTGAGAGGESGWTANAAGDFNGDGYDDFAVGARYAGTAWVVFGTGNLGTGDGPAIIDLAALNGGNGFTLTGPDSASVGVEVAPGGDVNGDGYDDLLIGADFAGRVQIVFGGAQWGSTSSPPVVNVGDLAPAAGLVLLGPAGAGFSLAAGDLNGDGLNDVVTGAPFADPLGRSDAGQVWVAFGRADWGTEYGPSDVDMTSLTGTDGFTLYGAADKDHAGYSVAAAADIDGDGLHDLLVGVPGNVFMQSSSPGMAHLIFGRRAASDADFDGVADSADNCSEAHNPDQRDTDADGYGNACDADLNDDGVINFFDLGLLRLAFFSSGEGLDEDFDGNGTVDFLDLGVLKAGMFGPPGPAGTLRQAAAKMR